MTVRDVIDHRGLKLELVTGSAGVERSVRDAVLPRLSLPPIGRPERMSARIQLLGPTALAALAGMEEERQHRTAAALCALEGAAIIVPVSPEMPAALVAESRRTGLPLLRTSASLQTCRAGLKSFLGRHLARETSVHGVLMEVSGVGVLILGPSGIGKSESALDLIMRGHRLIADDLVLVRRPGGDRLMGRGADLAGAHMEIRGLGIINIQELFGVAAVLRCKDIELVVDMVKWDSYDDGDRLGLDEKRYDLLGVELPYLRIPVSYGRNMAVILEVAARNHLLKDRGCYTARSFARILSRRLEQGGGAKRRSKRS